MRLPPCCTVILIKVLQQAMNGNTHSPFLGGNSNDMAVGGVGMIRSHLSIDTEQIERYSVCIHKIY